MKRLVFLILLCLIGYLHTTAQTAYYDALKLKALLIQKNGALVFDDSKWSQVFQILKPYTYNPQTGAYQDSDKDIYKNFCIANGRNPFICDYFAGGFAGGAQNFIASVANSVGNTNISTIADGLTKFLIERAKEELFIAFFSNLKNNQKFPEFPVLFPHTQVLLNNFNSWEYSNIINSLREAFDKDLQDLLVDIPKLKDVDCSKCETDAKNRINAFKKFVQQTDDGRIFLSALQLGNGFISEQKVSDVIHIIASDTSYLLNMPSVKANLNIKNGIRLFDILSYSIRSNVNGVSYISGNDFKAMITDPVAGNIYLGLIYQQLKNENIQIGAINLANYLNTNKAAAIQPYLNNLLTQGDALATAINNLLAAKKKGEKDLTTYWAANFESGKQLLLSLTNISLIEPTLTFDKTIQNVFNYSTQTLEIAHDVALRNYNAAVIGTINFISSNFKSSGLNSEFMTFFVKYGSFAGNLIQAQSSDDAEKAIESVALPAGSASIKKNTNLSIALNGYLGGFYGNEYLADKATNKWGATTGVYAPIGVTFSKRISDASFSLFVQVIDLGAVAAYRLNDPNTANLPNFTLQNILAPGIGGIIGVPKWPLSIGYTYQLGPELRSINATNTVVSSSLNSRWQFFIAVDIPLFSLYTKPK